MCACVAADEETSDAVHRTVYLSTVPLLLPPEPDARLMEGVRRRKEDVVGHLLLSLQTPSSFPSAKLLNAESSGRWFPGNKPKHLGVFTLFIWPAVLAKGDNIHFTNSSHAHPWTH